jgi:hypothetical protein
MLSLDALNKYFGKLTDVIRSRYLIAYQPAKFSPDGRYRSIRVGAVKDGTRFKVHVRKGYYTRTAPNRVTLG